MVYSYSRLVCLLVFKALLCNRIAKWPCNPRPLRSQKHLYCGFLLLFSGVLMPTGIVKWFNESKGFGFIAPDEGGPDLFAHFSDIQSSGFRVLFENQTCTFELKQGPKGAQASDIKPGPEPEGARRRGPSGPGEGGAGRRDGGGGFGGGRREGGGGFGGAGRGNGGGGY
jgi:cold shock protein